MKRVSSTLILTALVLSALGFQQAQASRGSKPPAMQRGAASIRFAPKLIREANRKQRLTIKVRYPQAIGARDERLQQLNQAIKDVVMEQINAFKKDFEPPDQRMGSTGSYFEIGYGVDHASGDLVSIGFTIDMYGEGAAHPNHVSFAFNYDLKAGRELKLADLFKSNSDYLQTISAYSIKALKKELGPQSDSEWIEKGAGASEENYKSWTVDRKGLTISFDAYQVASYAEGPRVVIIPYSALKNVIDPAGPLAKLVK